MNNKRYTMITYTNGRAVEHLHYLPYGETQVDQRATSYAARYTFSAKEKDEETGYSYFGARYYNSDLSIWLSVDPMSDKYPSTSPYAYCRNNPLILVDPDGEDDYEIFLNKEGKAEINVMRNDKNSNTYKYVNADGTKSNLGTYAKTGNMVKLDKNTDFYEQTLYSQGNNYLDGDAAAGFLGAAYSYNQETGNKVKVNQFMSVNGCHSGKKEKSPCIDIQYAGTNKYIQAETNKGNVDYQKSQILVDKIRQFGFNERSYNWNILTENGTGSSAALNNTHLYSGHKNHMHIQGFNKSIIKVMQ